MLRGLGHATIEISGGGPPDPRGHLARQIGLAELGGHPAEKRSLV